MEDQVYLCTWKKSAKGFALWVTKRPFVRGEGATYEAAEEKLIEAIQERGGAMVAVLEFDPPLPKTAFEEKYGQPEIVRIGGDDCFMTDAPKRKPFERAADIERALCWLEDYYDQHVCRECRLPSGRRTKKLITLEYATKDDGAFASIGRHGSAVWQWIFSEEFLALLTPAEKRRLKFQPTIRARGRKFFELVGPEGPPLVAVKGLKLDGWRCPKCPHRTFGYYSERMTINQFVAKSDLPKRLPSLFTVGKYPKIYLAATAARWKELVGKKGTRGFTSQRIGVVSDKELIREPKLPIRKD